MNCKAFTSFSIANFTSPAKIVSLLYTEGVSFNLAWQSQNRHSEVEVTFRRAKMGCPGTQKQSKKKKERKQAPSKVNVDEPHSSKRACHSSLSASQRSYSCHARPQSRIRRAWLKKIHRSNNIASVPAGHILEASLYGSQMPWMRAPTLSGCPLSWETHTDVIPDATIARSTRRAD